MSEKIVLRSTPYDQIYNQTKYDILTYEELDKNFVFLDEKINELNVTRNIVLSSHYETLSDALIFSYNTDKIFVIDSEVSVTGVNDVLFSSAIFVLKSGNIFVPEGQTLTIQGSFKAGNYPIFSGLGTVVFLESSLTELSPEWWGVNNLSDIPSNVSFSNFSKTVTGNTLITTNDDDVALTITQEGTGKALVIDGTWEATGQVCRDLGTITTADLNGGSIDNTTIGAEIPSSGKFTNLNVTGNVTVVGTVTGTSFNNITSLSYSAPLKSGDASIGISTNVSREDHVHPIEKIFFDGTGLGDADGSFYDGSSEINISYNTINAAPSEKGVTNGDTHNHSGGDGGQINHTTLSNIGTNTHTQIDDAIASLSNYQLRSEKGQPNGYAPLNGSGKLEEVYLPDTVLGQLVYQTVWNASTNVPTIPTASLSNKGWYYIVNVSGTTLIDGISDWQVGDWILSNGITWTKVDNTDAVSSVFGRSGAIVANSGDYTASQITNVPSGNLVSITVQAALNELDSEKEVVGSTATHAALTQTHGVSGEIVGTNNTQTLTQKTLTSPTINGGTWYGSINGNWNAVGQTCTNLGSVTTADIDGGTIDNTAIGNNIPSTGIFTDLTAQGNVVLGDARTDSISLNGNIINNVLIGYTSDTGEKLQVNGSVKATTFYGALIGNSTSSDKFSTARTINGTSFDGTANITTSYWGTSRTLTIGNTGKSVDGSGNISWSLSEIGAAATSHAHGNITNDGAIGSTANLPIITTTSGVLTTGSFGTTVNTFCQGNDSRLSDTRNTTNSYILKFDTGVTEGTDLYTFNGSIAKTIDIKAGTNVSLTKSDGVITISANDTSVNWSEIQSKPTTLLGYGITDATPSSHIGATGAAHGVATTSVNGFMSSTDKTKLDGITANANNYTLPNATSTVYGGVKLGSDTSQTVAANAVTTTASRTYAIQNNASGQLVTNIPWTDTVYTNGTGLSLIGTTFSVNYGTTSTTACVGNDSRLSDTRNTTNSITFNNSGIGSSSGVSFNGSTATTISYNTIGASPLIHNHNYIIFTDTRTIDFNAYDYDGVSYHLKTNTTDTLVDGGTYHGVLNLSQWSDSSGGNAHQVAFTDNQNIWHRATADGTTYSTWKKLLNSSNYSSYALPLTGGTVTGTTTFSSINVTGGTINGTAIGGMTPAAGAFTTVRTSGTITQALGTNSGSYAANSFFTQYEGPNILRSYICGSNEATYPSWKIYTAFSTGTPLEILSISSTGLSVTGKVVIDGTNSTTSMGGISHLDIQAGDADNEFAILRFATDAGGSIASIGGKATTTGAYPNSYGELHLNVQTGAGAITPVIISSTGLSVAGTLTATSKSFLIDHPTKEGYKLRYGSLEGPENGVYIRGKLKDSNIIELPEYWTKLIDPDSITVNLTSIGNHQNLFVVKIENNCVYIANENLFNKTINCFYTIFAERIDIDKMEVEYEG